MTTSTDRNATAHLWPMLLALTGAFALSQAYRTVTALMAPPLATEFALSPSELGLFAAIFHFSFGALQLLMGVGIDMYGVRRVVLFAFPLTVAGALLSAAAQGFDWLLAGQVLIGIGCAPAFLVCTVFVAQRFPPERFAPVSGAVLGLGGVGMLFTGTPLAWMIEASSWRVGFLVLAALSAAAWVAILLVTRERPATASSSSASVSPASASASPAPPRAGGESLLGAVRGFAALLALPHTWGILCLGAVTYASFVTLRGLWLGPLMIDRHHATLVQAGHLALLVSLISMAGPPLFGRFDPGPLRRRAWMVMFTLLCAAIFAAMAFLPHLAVDVGGSLLFSLIGGYIVYQYADVRAAYPAAVTGRALALFTMSMFLGIALMQWLTGLVATAALAHGLPVYNCVLAFVALMLVAGAAAFRLLPAPPAEKAEPRLGPAQ